MDSPSILLHIGGLQSRQQPPPPPSLTGEHSLTMNWREGDGTASRYGPNQVTYGGRGVVNYINLHDSVVFHFFFFFFLSESVTFDIINIE